MDYYMHMNARNHYWVQVTFCDGSSALVDTYASTTRRAENSARRQAEHMFGKTVHSAVRRSDL